MISFGPQLADWARSSEALLQHSLASPTPTTVGVVFAGGLLTSLGPCSLSLLPVTLAYLAGFGGTPGVKPSQAPWQRSLSFAAGIVASLVLLGLVSGLLGRIYGQIPGLIPTVVAVLALLMGLNLLGLLKLPLPAGPDPEIWRRRVPAPSGSDSRRPSFWSGRHTLHHPCTCGAAGLDGPERQTTCGHVAAH
jgi:Cytochrome c biogenesis protein